jgi:MFS family permease
MVHFDKGFVRRYVFEDIHNSTPLAQTVAAITYNMFSKLHLESNALLATVTTLTCLGFLLIGYDNGLMGGFVNSPAFTGTFGIDTKTDAGTNMIALVVAVYEIGCFVGAVTTSFVGEGLGRRKSVLIGVIILIIGSHSL